MRFGKKFSELKEKKEGAFIPFVVLGDPDEETSLEILEALAKHADCLELGFPFSDPIADGKRIQAADERALEKGMNYEKCFAVIKKFRERHEEIPIGLLLYYNLVYSNGCEEFIAKAKDAGVDALLVVDLPPEEAGEFREKCIEKGIEEIFIVAPTSSDERIEKISSLAGAFIYTVGILGVTGERSDVQANTVGLVKRVKKHSKLPVCVGFGISKPEHAKKIIDAGADGAIVGSAIEAIIEKNLGDKGKMLSEIDSFAKEMKGATR